MTHRNRKRTGMGIGGVLCLFFYIPSSQSLSAPLLTRNGMAIKRSSQYHMNAFACMPTIDVVQPVKRKKENRAVKKRIAFISMLAPSEAEGIFFSLSLFTRGSCSTTFCCCFTWLLYGELFHQAFKKRRKNERTAHSPIGSILIHQKNDRTGVG